MSVDEPDDFLVLPDNVAAVNLFMACQTYWKLLSGMAGAMYLGISPVDLESVIRLKRIPENDWPELLESIQIMEDAALPVLNANLK